MSVLAHAHTFLAGAGAQRHVEARMVVQQGQWVAAPARCVHVALEVDLPQRIGALVLEALPGLGCLRSLGGDQAMAMQDGRDRAGCQAAQTQIL